MTFFPGLDINSRENCALVPDVNCSLSLMAGLPVQKVHGKVFLETLHVWINLFRWVWKPNIQNQKPLASFTFVLLTNSKTPPCETWRSSLPACSVSRNNSGLTVWVSWSATVAISWKPHMVCRIPVVSPSSQAEMVSIPWQKWQKSSQDLVERNLCCSQRWLCAHWIVINCTSSMSQEFVGSDIPNKTFHLQEKKTTKSTKILKNTARFCKRFGKFKASIHPHYFVVSLARHLRLKFEAFWSFKHSTFCFPPHSDQKCLRRTLTIVDTHPNVMAILWHSPRAALNACKAVSDLENPRPAQGMEFQ